MVSKMDSSPGPAASAVRIPEEKGMAVMLGGADLKLQSAGTQPFFVEGGYGQLDTLRVRSVSGLLGMATCHLRASRNCVAVGNGH